MLVVSNIHDGFDVYKIPSGAIHTHIKIETHSENSALPVMFINDNGQAVLGGSAVGDAFVWDINMDEVSCILEHPGQ